MSASFWGGVYPYSTLASAFTHKGGMPHAWNFSRIVDDYYVDQWLQVKRTIDPVDRARLMKELNLYLLDMCYNIQLPTRNEYIFWQLWVKEYCGEYFAGTRGDWSIGIVKHLWIDQDMKYEMTGRR